MIIQILYSLQFGARDQDCILVKRTGIWSGYKKKLKNHHGYGAESERWPADQDCVYSGETDGDLEWIKKKCHDGYGAESERWPAGSRS